MKNGWPQQVWACGKSTRQQKCSSSFVPATDVLVELVGQAGDKERKFGWAMGAVGRTVAGGAASDKRGGLICGPPAPRRFCRLLERFSPNRCVVGPHSNSFTAQSASAN